MKLLSRFAIFSILLFAAGRAFAQGGACPASANYANPAGSNPGLTNPPVTLLSLGVTSCFYISGAGSDTNSGTSESSPWAHAPGMPNCSGNCAKTNPTGGEGFIFHGGDTWHFGNSGAAPYSGGTWTFSWSGSSGTPIYIGVDPGWHSGSLWARPIMNGDNPTSTKAVSSCAYQTGGGNVLLSWGGQQYTILDNFELTGLCEANSNLSFGSNNALVESGGSNNIYEHLYFHGWTHLPFSCGSGSNFCFDLGNIIASNNPSDQHFQIVIDGSDSDPQGAGTMFLGCYNVSQSVFNNAIGMVCNQFHSFHDNLMMNLTQAGDYTSHGNVFESSGEYSGNNVFYNNVIHDVCNTPGVSCAVVGIWPEPTVGFTDYFFNNVMYNIHVANGNYFNVGQNANSGNQGTLDLWNNTFENLDAGAIVNCDGSGFAEPLNLTNNHYIVDLSSPYNENCPSGTTTYTSEISKTHAAANAGGYTASQTYAYSPASSSAYTVGAGTNLASTYCSTLLASSDPLLQAAGQACKADAGYACRYDSTHHAVVCPERTKFARPGSGPWSIGAYQPSQAPSAPTNLNATSR